MDMTHEQLMERAALDRALQERALWHMEKALWHLRDAEYCRRSCPFSLRPDQERALASLMRQVAFLQKFDPSKKDERAA